MISVTIGNFNLEKCLLIKWGLSAFGDFQWFIENGIMRGVSIEEVSEAHFEFLKAARVLSSSMRKTTFGHNGGPCLFEASCMNTETGQIFSEREINV